MGEIVATASQKGGVGKTTTAVNLSASLAILEKKVLLVDMDPQGSVGANFGLTRYNIDYGMFDILIKGKPIIDAIIETKLEGFDIVPVNIWSESQEVEFVKTASNVHLLKHVLKTIKDNYDYIIIDCPPSIGALTLNAIVSADSLLIPVQCEFFALKALGRFLKMTRSIRDKYNPDLIYKGFVLTMVDYDLKKTESLVKDLELSLKDLLFQTKIPRNSQISEAPSYSIPVALLDVASEGSIAYLELAKEMINLNNS